MTEEKQGKKRTVLVAVDGSEHSERAFDCKYEIFRDSMCPSDTSLVPSDPSDFHLFTLFVSLWYHQLEGQKDV